MGGRPLNPTWDSFEGSMRLYISEEGGVQGFVDRSCCFRGSWIRALGFGFSVECFREALSEHEVMQPGDTWA